MFTSTVRAHTGRLASPAVVFAALVCVWVFSCPSAFAGRGHTFAGTVVGEPCSSNPCGPGQLSEAAGVAVNEATGQLYVLDRGENRIERYSSAGVYEGTIDGSETPAKEFEFSLVKPEPYIGGIAVDNSCYIRKLSVGECTADDPSNGDLYVVDAQHEVVDKFSVDSKYRGQLEVASGGEPYKIEELRGVTVANDGTVWTSSDDAGSQLESFSSAETSTFVSKHELGSLTGRPDAYGFAAAGLAIAPNGDAYVRKGFVADEQKPEFVITKTNPQGIALTELSTEEVSAVAVDEFTGEVFLDGLTSVGAVTEEGQPEEQFGSGVLVDGAGLAVDHANGTVYVADLATGKVDVFSPQPASAPTVRGESFSDVSGAGATLEAEVNPEGDATEYSFEYGRCPSLEACVTAGYEASAPVPDAFAGSDFEVHGVSARVEGLQPYTAYHFRVVAHNGFDPSAPVDGEEVAFVTQAEGGPLSLPDSRQWEMVSPPQKSGALILTSVNFLQQAAGGGEAITYQTSSATESNPAGYPGLVQALSRRSREGWQSADISLPHERALGTSVGQGTEYRFFSEDLGLAVVQPFGPFIPSSSPFALSPQATEQTAFVRSDYAGGDVELPCAQSCYQPLVTAAPGAANVPAGTAFGEEGKCPVSRTYCGPEFVAASPDSTHVVLEAKAALTEGAGPDRLYEWGAGRLSLVSVLPDTKAASGAVGGGFSRAAGAVSEDGGHVVWSQPGALYDWDAASGRSVQLDVPELACVEKGGCGGSDSPEFYGASRDGSVVLFSDIRPLTEDAGASTTARDLYRCEIEEVAGLPSCRLSDLTPPHSGEAAGVENVLGYSRDASWVYFAASGKLVEGAQQANCGRTGDGDLCNVYVWHNGVVRLVAEINPIQDRQAGLVSAGATRVSSDGRWLAFMSNRSLTGYDTRDAVTGRPDEEVYLYDGVQERLVCASCDPTGARPVGIVMSNLVGERAVGNREWGDVRIAANIPGGTQYKLAESLYSSRALFDGGRLFFNSSDALVSQDVNGQEDVYEFEPPGIGGCVSTSTSFNASSRGCVSLISSGSSIEESAFVDASETGGDVFFGTSAKLAPEDFDTSFDIYDAHECSTVSPCLPTAPPAAPPCATADGCRAAQTPQPPIFGSPSSATFTGAGNVQPPSTAIAPRGKTRRIRAAKLKRALRACHKLGSRRRRVCEARARRRYGGVAAKKTDKAGSRVKTNREGR